MENNKFEPFRKDGFLAWINEKDEVDLELPKKPLKEIVDFIDKYNVVRLRINSFAWQKNDLDDLKFYKDIKELVIGSTFIEDFSGLKYLQSLTHLTLIPQINAEINLNLIPNLEYLSYWANTHKINGTSACQNLTFLHIGAYKPNKYKFLNLPSTVQLLTLDLSSFHPKDRNLVYLPEFSSLKSLHINSTNISSLKGIERYKELRDLVIGNAPKLTDLNPLGNLKKISSLTLKNVKKNIQFDIEITSLKDLEKLHLVNLGEIDNLNWVEYLPKLKELVLIKSVIKDNDLSVLVNRNWNHLYFDEKKSYSHQMSEMKLKTK